MATAPRPNEFLQSSLDTDKVQSTVERYAALHDAASTDERRENYEEMVNDYYDLATDFYEFGWGQSFHFGVRHRGETLPASLARHQHYVAHRLGLQPGMRAIDLGCGVGGPMRGIARFSGADIVGLNNNAYQIRRGEEHTMNAGLSARCSFIKGDFMNITEPAESYDAAYTFEATCHAPDRTACFEQIYRVLKPGASFAGYEWCLTHRYDEDNAEHRQIKDGILRGNGLPDLTSTESVLQSLRDAGFEVIDSADMAPRCDPDTPWYLPLSGAGYTPMDLVQKPAGRWMTNKVLGVLERMKVVPKGTQEISGVLNDGAVWLVRGGQTETFTPMFFFLARKPL